MTGRRSAMTTTIARLAAGALLALLASIAAQARASGSAAATASAPGSRLSSADASFMEKAAHAGVAEVESGKLAVEKGSNAQLRTFAQQMVDDHGRTNEELKALAQAKGVQLPDGLSIAQKAKLKLLSASDGTSFDHRYADTMGVSAHRNAVQLFQKAAASAQDPDVKAFAIKTLPMVSHHLAMARGMKASVDKAGAIRIPASASP
jgi:putative membrane protein